MTRIEWYYAREDKTIGPMAPSEIKQLADAGQLKPDNLVWREGMEDWVPAEMVKGLFDQTEPATAAPALPGSTPTTTVPESTVPAVAPVHKPERPAFEPSAARYVRSRKGPRRHLFDMVLDRARREFTGEFVDSTARIFAVCGHYGLYVAMLAVLTFGLLTAAIQMNEPVAAGLAVVGVVILAVLQYGASRFCAALERLNRSTEGTLRSTVLPDCLGLASMMLALTLLPVLTVAAIQMELYNMILAGLAAFIMCAHLAFVSLNPATLSITVAADASAEHEALGSITFLLKVGLRVVPVVFGVGVIWGTLNVLWAFYWLLQGAEGIANVMALTAALWTIAYAALPGVAYLGFLTIHLAVTTVRAILTRHGDTE
jgi:hypothetical protein